MLYYNTINLSVKGIDSSRSNNSKECVEFNYWFFNHGFEYQDSVCNGCHDLTMLCLNQSNISVITVEGVICCCIIHGTSKSHTIHLLENFVPDDCEYI